MLPSGGESVLAVPRTDERPICKIFYRREKGFSGGDLRAKELRLRDGSALMLYTDSERVEGRCVPAYGGHGIVLPESPVQKDGEVPAKALSAV